MWVPGRISGSLPTNCWNTGFSSSNTDCTSSQCFPPFDSKFLARSVSITKKNTLNSLLLNCWKASNCGKDTSVCSLLWSIKETLLPLLVTEQTDRLSAEYEWICDVSLAELKKCFTFHAESCDVWICRCSLASTFLFKVWHICFSLLTLNRLPSDKRGPTGQLPPSAWLTVPYQALLQPQLNMQVKGVRKREITTCCLCMYQTLSVVRADRVSVLTYVRWTSRKLWRSPFSLTCAKQGGRCFSLGSWLATSLKDYARAAAESTALQPRGWANGQENKTGPQQIRKVFSGHCVLHKQVWSFH